MSSEHTDTDPVLITEPENMKNQMNNYMKLPERFQNNKFATKKLTFIVIWSIPAADENATY